MKNKTLILYFLLLAVFSFYTPLIAQQHNDGESEYLQKLLDGNKRFVEGKFSYKDYKTEVKELANGQHPYTIILSCSDSRVPPEIIFDESMGKLFVVRVAGNIVDEIALGSIEYAAEHLHAKLLVVLGHESCGAVTATIGGGEVTPNIEEIVKKISPAVEKAKKNHPENEVLHCAIKENVFNQIEESLKHSKLLTELHENGELKIVGALYDINSGKVSILEHHKD